MERKNLIIAALAIVFAVGSAFSTREDLVNTAYAKLIPSQGANFICTNVNTCDNLTGAICEVRIKLASGLEKTVQAHKVQTNCSETWFQTGELAPGVYDAGEGDRPFDAID